ncbi:helix-turn-helix domain-containing protein [Terriglobus aquaticus]|uniref:Helix-turn-helix domain-containing protein n=1 Tax=Terriglobus aquaticus TaxID=940139 RepID=A0ABW9KSL6_9BACT|nr:helix-turn-helix transcriptional regulator [Terriglobus aquaticus]
MSLSLSYTPSSSYPTSTPNILTEFGIRLRDLRRERKLSDVDLAWSIGITRAHLQDIEEGKEEIDLEMLWDISGALGISMATAMEGL